jgi:hypothetical protein
MEDNMSSRTLWSCTLSVPFCAALAATALAGDGRADRVNLAEWSQTLNNSVTSTIAPGKMNWDPADGVRLASRL